jgi:hypothetical protein
MGTWCYIVGPFAIFNWHLGYFLVSCTKKNLATLLPREEKAYLQKSFLSQLTIKWGMLAGWPDWANFCDRDYFLGSFYVQKKPKFVCYFVPRSSYEFCLTKIELGFFLGTIFTHSCCHPGAWERVGELNKKTWIMLSIACPMYVGM